jgi:hypothetical protein
MTEAPSTTKREGPVVPVRPQPNVYTVLLVIAVIALVVAIAVVAWRMTAEMPAGYGLDMKHLFQPNTPLPLPPR